MIGIFGKQNKLIFVVKGNEMPINTYKGGDINLIEKYIEGVPIEYHDFTAVHQAGDIREWKVVTPYSEPADIHRVSNKNYTFREKQVAKQYVKISFDSEMEGTDYHDLSLEVIKVLVNHLYGGYYEPHSDRDVKLGEALENLHREFKNS